MKIQGFLTFSFCFLLGGLMAQEVPDSTFLPKENALLWEISGSNLKKSSYLFGTIHLIDKGNFRLSEGVKAAIDKSENITFEIDIEEEMSMAALMPLMNQMFMKDNKRLKDLLNDEEYKLVEDHFQKLGLPLSFLDRIKPMFLSIMASEDIANGGGMLDANSKMVSYEMELLEIAKQKEKEVDGLESADFQMSLFDSIPYDVQAQMLVTSIESSGEEDLTLDKMVELYLSEDINGMQILMKEEGDGLGNYEELLLISRNRNWIPIMSEKMMIKPTFFAVGAGHLGGLEGVIALLRHAGYTVKPIKS